MVTGISRSLPNSASRLPVQLWMTIDDTGSPMLRTVSSASTTPSAFRPLGAMPSMPPMTTAVLTAVMFHSRTDSNRRHAVRDEVADTITAHQPAAVIALRCPVVHGPRPG